MTAASPELGTHGRGVERFYSHGAEARARESKGFLSFGYWTDDTRDYTEAAENLLRLLLDSATPMEAGDLLNVACGNGVETVAIFERLRPRRIRAIDITRAHIATANRRAAALGLADRLIFEHGDACRTRFAADTFTHVIGIEGIAHFDTRESFLAEAARVLRPGGQLLLSDCILHRLPPGLLDETVSALCSYGWHMPRANWVDIPQYTAQLERAGFRVEAIRSIGASVYPGFARFNLKPSAIKTAIAQRGLPVGVGLTFISWLLGEVFRRGVSDYVLVKAFKR